MEINRAEVKKFMVVFLISLAMIYTGWVLNFIVQLYIKYWLCPAILPLQVFTFIAGGAIIAWTKWQRAEWYMFFSFIIVGVVYFSFADCSYRNLNSLITMSFALTFGLFISVISNWLMKKIM